MARTGQADEAGRLHARVDVAGSGEASVSTGVGVLDHLLGLLAEYASFDLALEIAPGEAEAEIAAASRSACPSARPASRQTRRSLTSSSRLPGGRSWSRTSTSATQGP